MRRSNALSLFRRQTAMILFWLFVTVGASMVEAKTEMRFAGADIPQRISVGTGDIFYDSDSLWLNGRLLKRDIDYLFDGRSGTIDLTRLNHSPTDTLVLSYEPLPAWMRRIYGRPLPSVAAQGVDRSIPASPAVGKAATLSHPDITIAGAKSFQFSARSTGGSDFSQSLDLHVSGSLAPGITISGAVSDRGYDPAYGTSNSRISELDKVNLSVKSSLVSAQIGDIAVSSSFDRGATAVKRVAGAGIRLRTGRWYVEGTAARPKGRFETFGLPGQDGVQGPYQIGAGSRVRSVVPGSEQVWLDGMLLERGADKDYTIDYPSGQITFSAAHAIDQRRRIEVDYEPAAADFRGEILATGAGVSAGDSAFYVAAEFVREGDDRDLPLRMELSSGDRDLLAAVGDSIELAVRSGVTPDSNGSYILIADSLPDSVFRFVGTGSGDFSVAFSSVGAGNGRYRYLGEGQYQFVGSGQGDYEPIVTLSVPQRTDYYNSRAGVRVIPGADVEVEYRQSVTDRNLFSNRDDDDNRATLLSTTVGNAWQWHGQENRFSLRGRWKEAAFKSRHRLFEADFSRTYLLPDSAAFGDADEHLYEFDLSVSPVALATVSPFVSLLEYVGRFRSLSGGVRTRVNPHRRLTTSVGWRETTAKDMNTRSNRNGESRNLTAAAAWQVLSSATMRSGFEFDRRENDYTGERRGTRYSRYTWETDGRSEKLNIEHYLEDTLQDSWQPRLTRSRVSASSQRTLGNLASTAAVSYQWLRLPQGRDGNLLARLYLHYYNASRRLDLSTSYSLSDETRHARGVIYLQVDPGQGSYAYENGEYVPDPDGGFVRVEEILSTQSRVSRAEKSFRIERDFGTAMVRLNSALREELLEDGRRTLWWVVPFVSDDAQPYLFYTRHFDGDLRIFPIRTAYAINVLYSEDREIRDVAGSRKVKRDATATLSLKQAVNSTFLEENLELFDYDRNDYFAAGGTAEGYRAGAIVRQLLSAHEISAGGGFRRAESDHDERSELYSFRLGTRLQITGRGEIRGSLELYRQVLTNTTGAASFVLTDNRPGKRGAIWSLNVRYGIRGGVRANLSVSGRHADDRTARVTGRGDVIVEF
ncbi:MAG TPA: hypothetical protein VN285_11050 [Candidatus Deferrimicrobium sp.]|nr:hypothetical protein [Candidatus Deferrimicrobium sp.]